MSFRKTLQDIVSSVEDAIGAVIMGYDGISIDEYLASDVEFDLPLLSVEYATLLKDVRSTLDTLQGGDMEEVSFSTSRLLVVARPVNSEFFLMILLKSSGNFGKARFVLKREAFNLKDALA